MSLSKCAQSRAACFSFSESNVCCCVDCKVDCVVAAERAFRLHLGESARGPERYAGALAFAGADDRADDAAHFAAGTRGCVESRARSWRLAWRGFWFCRKPWTLDKPSVSTFGLAQTGVAVHAVD